MARAIDFSLTAFLAPLNQPQGDTDLKKVEDLEDTTVQGSMKPLEAHLSPQQLEIMQTMRAKKTVLKADIINIDHFTSDVLDGRMINMVQGDLGLVAVDKGSS